jgi:hypothetical protein
MAEFTKKFSDLATKGGGFLDWERLEERLRESGELTEQDKIKTLEVTEEGIHYSTRKRKKSEQ